MVIEQVAMPRAFRRASLQAGGERGAGLLPRLVCGLLVALFVLVPGRVCAEEGFSVHQIVELLQRHEYERALEAIDAAEEQSISVALAADGLRLSALHGLERWDELETVARREAETALGAHERLESYEPGVILDEEMLDSSGDGALKRGAVAYYYLGLAIFNREVEKSGGNGRAPSEARFQEAEEALKRALALAPSAVPYAPLVLGRLHEWQGRPEDALRMIEQYLESHPGDRGTLELRRDLEAQVAPDGS